ncbi:MAG: cell division protein ZapA [Minisyncoccota bacterium]
MKKRFEVRILGQELSVISDSGDEHVADVVRYVSDKVEEAGKAAGTKNSLNIAILAALNIADEYLRVRGVKENIYSQLESRSEQLINLINDSR